MNKQVIFSEEARNKLKVGVNIVGDTVGITLGAKGRNVILDKGIMPPLVTNDGVTIAKDIFLKDRFEQMGAQLIKEAASNTNDTAGDGTTTATVLAQAMINEGLKNVAAGANPMILKKGIQAATEEVIAKLRTMKKEVKDDDVCNIATISSGDAEVGQAIADVMKKVGTDGVVTVEEGQKIGLFSEVTEGMQFDNGYISPYFVTDIPRMEATFEDAYILVTDKKISSSTQVIPIIEKLIEAKIGQLVIIAEDVEGEALAAMVVNTTQNRFKILAVRAPGFGERRKEYLEDIAIVTGGTLVSEDLNFKLEEIGLSYLGRAEKVFVTKDKTTLIGSKGSKKEIERRLSLIKNQIEKATLDYDKEKLKERYAKISGGIGVIKVGAPTESEMKEKKYRIEDALNATKAATDPEDGGILPGGGAALAKVLLDMPKNVDPDFLTGYAIVQKACYEPVHRIATNAGAKGDVVVNFVSTMPENVGYNALTGEYVDMPEAGIIDPLKVTITALTNASSCAQMILSTGAIVVDEIEDRA